MAWATNCSDCSSKVFFLEPDRRSAWRVNTSACPTPSEPSSSAPSASGIFCIASPRSAACAASRSPRPALAAVFLGSDFWPCCWRRRARAVTLANTPTSHELTVPISALRASIASAGIPAICSSNCRIRAAIGDRIGCGHLDQIAVHRERHQSRLHPLGPPCQEPTEGLRRSPPRTGFEPHGLKGYVCSIVAPHPFRRNPNPKKSGAGVAGPPPPAPREAAGRDPPVASGPWRCGSSDPSRCRPRVDRSTSRHPRNAPSSRSSRSAVGTWCRPTS